MASGARRMQRLLFAAVGGVLLAWAVYLVRVARIDYPLQALTPEVEARLWRGGFHIHSELSDGRGTVEEIAEAARRAGSKWLVMAEHNVVDPAGTRYEGGVLLVSSSEISTKSGHVVAVGITREMEAEERKADPLGIMRSLGATPVAAHPLNRKRPYDTLEEDKQLVGMEILSGDDLFREAMRPPFGSLLAGAAAYPANPQHGIAQLVTRPEATLAMWDRLLEKRTLAGLCSLDAHGIPPYEDELRALALYALLDRPPTGDAAADAHALQLALSHGKAFCGLDSFGSAAGFRYEARAQDGVHELGDEVALAKAPLLRAELRYAKPVEGAELALYCGGVAVAHGPSPLEYRPTKPGACRVEVTTGARTAWGAPKRQFWIFSNPIYVR